ncbi:hypothetical protein P4S72_27180 [Vibrio sp. PP-XX7]
MSQIEKILLGLPLICFALLWTGTNIFGLFYMVCFPFLFIVGIMYSWYEKYWKMLSMYLVLGGGPIIYFFAMPYLAH